MKSEDQELLRIGLSIKNRRREKNWSIRDLADACGIAASTISQIETGKTSPNLLSLKAICGSLEIPMYSLFVGDDSVNIHLVREGERQTYIRNISNGKPLSESLIIEGKNDMWGGEIDIPSGTNSGEYAHHGGEEFVYILEGTVTFHLENNGVYILNKGDTLYYPNYIGHRWENTGDADAKMLIVSTDPYRF